MKRTQWDKERLMHNILMGLNSAYTKESEVYQRAHKALCKLSHREQDALWALVTTSTFNKRVVI